MFRRPSLPQAWFGLALGVAVCAAPPTVWAQYLSTPDNSAQDSLSTQERLDRLERDLNMLQRQVYRGAPTSPPAGESGGNPAVSDEIRLERLESQMRDLTGRVEEYANQVQQLRQRLEQINSDIGVRFQQLGGGSGATAANAPAAPADAAPGGATAGPSDEPPPPGTVVPGPAPIFGTLTPPGAAPARPPPQLASTPPAAPPAGPLPNASPARQYNYAFRLLKQANYAGAEAALREFLKQHPRDPMAGSAQYWLGETYYARQKYLEAASTFADGYKRYPRGVKAPEELLKLGMALGHANQKQNACVALAQLDRAFPHPGAAIKDQAVAEKKRLGCG